MGPVGYVVAHQVAAATLAIGTSVVIDAVNPVPEARSGWRAIADGARLIVLETTLSDPEEHRRRVTARRPDVVGLAVPSWDQVEHSEYVAWDESRDGPRHLIDMLDTEQGIAAALRHIGLAR